jgi:hypothetical protein
MGNVSQKTLMHEKEIIWLKDLKNFPWVREVELDFCQRQGIPKSRKSELEAGIAFFQEQKSTYFTIPNTGTTSDSAT